jgi:hypothetical protein
MLARIYSILGDASPSRSHAESCLGLADSPFHLGCAHEALARAAVVAGDLTGAEAHLIKARSLADCVEDADDRKILLDDLASVRAALDAISA